MKTKLVIPSILAATVLVAAAFAVMPIEKASTVHTTIQANTAKIDTREIGRTALATGAGPEFVITCPAATGGCRILEVFLDDDDTDADADLDVDAIDANISSDGLVTSIALDGDIVALADDDLEELVLIGGFSMGAGDTVEFQINEPGADDKNFRLKVVAEVQGGQTIGLTAPA